MDCPFYVGQKVTPISDQPWKYQNGGEWYDCPAQVVFGEVYTVDGFLAEFGEIGIYLKELRTGITTVSGNEGAWSWTAFRPVIEPKSKEQVEKLKRLYEIKELV